MSSATLLGAPAAGQLTRRRIRKSETSRSRSLFLPAHVTRRRASDLANGRERERWAGDREACRTRAEPEQRVQIAGCGLQVHAFAHTGGQARMYLGENHKIILWWKRRPRRRDMRWRGGEIGSWICFPGPLRAWIPGGGVSVLQVQEAVFHKGKGEVDRQERWDDTNPGLTLGTWLSMHDSGS